MEKYSFQAERSLRGHDLSDRATAHCRAAKSIEELIFGWIDAENSADLTPAASPDTEALCCIILKNGSEDIGLVEIKKSDMNAEYGPFILASAADTGERGLTDEDDYSRWRERLDPESGAIFFNALQSNWFPQKSAVKIALSYVLTGSGAARFELAEDELIWGGGIPEGEELNRDVVTITLDYQNEKTGWGMGEHVVATKSNAFPKGAYGWDFGGENLERGKSA